MGGAGNYELECITFMHNYYINNEFYYNRPTLDYWGERLIPRIAGLHVLCIEG